MSLVQKLMLNNNVMKNVNYLCSFRNVCLTAGQLDDENIIKNTNRINIPDISLSEFLVPKFETFRNYTAVECSETGKRYTYEHLLEKSNNFSNSLRGKLKLQKDDKVAIFSKNHPDYVVAVLGIIRSGLIVTTLNPLYTPDELSHQFLDSEARVIIAQVELIPVVREALIRMKKILPIIAIKENKFKSLPEGAIDFEELIDGKKKFQNVQIKSNDVVSLPYSSGTTGLPKGVELTNRNLVSNVLQVIHPTINLFDNASGSYQNIIPMVLPMYHIYGFFTGILSALCTGSKVITVPKFTPESYIEILEKYDVTHIFAAPPLILFLTNHEGVKTEHFRNIKVIVNGAAPLRYTDEIKILEKVKHGKTRFKQAYGMTETSPLMVMTPEGFQSSPETDESIGKLVPSSAAKIISVEDDSGRALKLGETGEILLKGPQVMKGYYKRSEETKKAFMDGWLRTGDIGYFNKDGVLFLTDRLKELIKVKGFQVPPAELEAISRTHTDVEDVGVIGIPHPTQGEVPRAYVVPRNKNQFNIEQFKEYVASKVAKYKQLAGGVEIVDQIPRNPSGKILRRQLKQQFLEKVF